MINTIPSLSLLYEELWVYLQPLVAFLDLGLRHD